MNLTMPFPGLKLVLAFFLAAYSTKVVIVPWASAARGRIGVHGPLGFSYLIFIKYKREAMVIFFDIVFSVAPPLPENFSADGLVSF